LRISYSDTRGGKSNRRRTRGAVGPDILLATVLADEAKWRSEWVHSTDVTLGADIREEESDV